MIHPLSRNIDTRLPPLFQTYLGVSLFCKGLIGSLLIYEYNFLLRLMLSEDPFYLYILRF